MANQSTPKKFVVEFLAKWIRDEDFRCQVLHREITSLQNWELTGDQIDDLTSLDKETILARILKEFEEGLGVELDKVKNEVIGALGPPILGPPPGAMGTVYTEGAVHVRGTVPTKIALDVESVVIVRGQGFEAIPQVGFQRGPASPVLADVLSVSCDVDVYQRATVRVTLDEAGEWFVRARNSAGDPWSTEVVKLQVV